MTITELYPAVQALHHADKLRLVQSWENLVCVSEGLYSSYSTKDLKASNVDTGIENLATK